MIDFYLETDNYKYAKEIHAICATLNTTFMQEEYPLIFDV